MSFKSLIAPLAATAFVLGPVSAFAQSSLWRLPSDTARYRSVDDAPAYYQIRQTAYDEGYREGRKKGEADGRRGVRFGYQDERDFQRADKGYHRSFGDRERYRQVFRDGYANGYSEGYSRYSRYGRNNGRQGPYAQQGPYSRPQGPYGQQGGYGTYGNGAYSPAFDNGARDGYEKGQEDARKNRSFDPPRHSWYRSGDRHFERRYGSREIYKDVYRRGFQQGYERGFREGRYRY
jgi:flagellar biosynthesis/type III secretory pathway protein FliH